MVLSALTVGCGLNGLSFSADAVCEYMPMVIRATPTCTWSHWRVEALGVSSDQRWTGTVVPCQGVRTPARGIVGGDIEILETPIDSNATRGIAINARGSVGGSHSSTQYAPRPCLWINDAFIDIPTDSPGAQGEVVALNDSDWAVGWRVVTNSAGAEMMGFIWHDGALIDIDPRPYGRVESSCRDIAESGWVAGTLGSMGRQDAVPFRWKGSALELRTPPAGTDMGRALGVAETGALVGESGVHRDDGSPVRPLPTLWRADGTAVLLPLPPGCTVGRCERISNDGVILGSAGYASGNTLWMHRAIWLNGRGFNLSSRSIANGPETVSLGDVPALSRNGVLAGSGSSAGDSVGVLLVPTLRTGDLNRDCRVDGTDLGMLLGAWGQAAVGTPADTNWDGTVDGQDLSTLLAQWTVAP